MDKKEKISELLSKPELVERLKACRGAEEIKNLAKENGLELTHEEAVQAIDLFSERELREDELNSVAGGCAPAQC